jgi:hypothetical protein
MDSADNLFHASFANVSRVPIDSVVHTFKLNEAEGWEAASEILPDAPEPRVAHAQTVVGDDVIFIIHF